jgi:tetratricopeptide (TPR) repeat protein
LTELIWDGTASNKATVTLRSHILHLRRALAASSVGGAETIVTASGGYRLAILPEELDAVRFRHGVRDGEAALAAHNPSVAAAHLHGAIAMWRGSNALQNVADRPFVARFAEDLAVVRRSAHDMRIEAELALGRHVELTAELRELARDSCDETAWSRLALALYRGQRLDEAARACRDGLEGIYARGLVAPRLRDLQSAILRRDAGLDWTPPRTTAMVKATATKAAGARTEPVLPVVQQLPPPPAILVGRERELSALDRMAEPEHGGVVVVSGGVGVGKTALALRWLWDRPSTADGVRLYARLRDDQGRPVAAVDVLGAFIRALAGPVRRLPTQLEERAGLFRSLTAARPALVLLDDACSAAQVRSLRPGGEHGLVVVTSRRRLGGLLTEGAQTLVLGPLNEEDSRGLLARMVGAERLREEPEAVAALERLCGGLACALRVAAARLAGSPHLRVACLVDEIETNSIGLDALTVDDVSVGASLDQAYLEMPADAARLYRQVALLPGTDFDRAMAAAIPGRSHEVVSHGLEALVERGALEGAGDGRYALHSLARKHARMLAESVDRPIDRDLTVQRAIDWYLACADAADRTVMPGRRRTARVFMGTEPCPPSFATAAAALAWLEAERANLMAAIRLAAGRHWYASVWQQVDAMWSLFLIRKHYGDWVTSHELGVAAARASGDPSAEAILLNHLGLAFHGLGRFEHALGRFKEALVVHRRMHDRRGEATAVNSSGLALLSLCRPGRAAAAFRRAILIQHEREDRRGEALTRANLGRASAALGQPTGACRHLARARAAFADLADPYNEARALRDLGQLYVEAGRADLAVRRLEPALDVVRELGSLFEEARVLDTLGDAMSLAGDTRAAQEHYGQALALYRHVGHPPADAPRRGAAPGTGAGR